MSPRLRGWLALVLCAVFVVLTGGGSRARTRRARTNREAPEADGAREWRLAGLRDESGRIRPFGSGRARRQLAASLGASAPTKTLGPVWIPRGPTNRGGHARALVIHPTQHDVMWAATGSGGVWKTTDGGASWRPLTDSFGLPSGSLALDPKNSDHLYWGTGERFHAGGPGAGVFESTDGGETWRQLAATATWQYVQGIAMSPADSRVMLVSVPDPEGDGFGGFFRSTDAGATWLRVFYGYNDTFDILFDPFDPTRAIAAAQDDRSYPAPSSVFYSRDGGLTWQTSAGVAGDGFTRWSLAIARSSPNVVYAFGEAGLYRSQDGGASFTRVRDPLYAPLFWANVLWVSPTDPDVVLAGGVLLARSTDGGVSFDPVNYYQYDPRYPFSDIGHEDQQRIVEDPGYDGGANKRVFLLNDGGIDLLDDVLAPTITAALAHSLDTDMQTTEVYTVAGRASDGLLMQAVQDSGVEEVRMPSTKSEVSYAGDGTCSLLDPQDARYRYGCSQYLDPYRIEPNKTIVLLGTKLPDAPYSHEILRANFMAPVLLDPNTPSRMIAAGSSLWRCDNVRLSRQDEPVWTEIKPALSKLGFNDWLISAVAIAAKDSNVIWVGHNDGRFFRTADGLASTPHWTAVDDNASLDPLPNRRPERILIDREDPARVYVAFGGFSPRNLWRTDDAGASWHPVTGQPPAGLPDAPVWALAQHPENRDTIYAGTEVGVFASADGGATWAPLSSHAFAVAVQDLSFIQGSSVLLAGTFGRGMWTLETNAPPPDTTPPRRRPSAAFR